jgi:hypothetical protein
VLFNYPKQAAFGKVLPKNKIYEKGSPSTSVKDLFVRQVDQIVWQYKLASETINLPATASVPEIQIFTITLKDNTLKHDVLRCIDQAVMYPIIFELRYDTQCKVVAAHKRPNESDCGKWVVSNYFETKWLPQNTARSSLPVVLDLATLYESLLSVLLPHPALPGERTQERVERMELIRIKNNEIDKCKIRLKTEKQFNLKVEINAELRTLKQELETLIRPKADS